MALTESSLAAWAGSSTSIRTNTITSASFTPAANSLVVVATGCGNVGGVTVTGITVSDSVSGSWTQLVRLSGGGQFADASVWVKDAGSSPSSQTVTVTMSPSTVQDVGLVVRQFTGAASAAGQTGVTNTASGSIATVGITPLTTGSQVVGAWGNADTANVTANGSTTFYGQTSDSGGAQEGAFEATSLSTANVALTLGYTATQGGSGLAVVEILPAPPAASPVVIAFPPPPWRSRYRPQPRLQVPVFYGPPSDSDLSVSADGGEQVTVISQSVAVTVPSPSWLTRFDPTGKLQVQVPPPTSFADSDLSGPEADAGEAVTASLSDSDAGHGTDAGEALAVYSAPTVVALSPSYRAAFQHRGRPQVPVFAPLGPVTVFSSDASRGGIDDQQVQPQPAIVILPEV